MRRRKPTQPLPPPPPPPAGRPVTRRRKLAELETPPVRDPVTKRRLAEPEPPPVDRISALPDDLLSEILLPVNDAARTQALMSRWRQLWRSVPLNLDCCDLVAKESILMHHRSLVSDVLSAHPGPGRRFCIRWQWSADHVDAWLGSTALDNLEEIDLGRGSSWAHHQPLPKSIIRFSATLRVLNIRYCSIPDAAVQGLRFPQLKQLGLDYVDVSERSLHSLIAGCPVLKSLLVLSSSGFRCLRVNSLSLTCLCVSMRIDETGMSAKSDFGKIIIENAPCLERLIHSYRVWGKDVWVYSAPKVESLDFLTDWQNFATELVSASRLIPRSPVDSPTTAVHTVKSLSFHLYYLSLDRVVDLMRLFPCLEKLHLKSKVSGTKNWWRRKHRKFIRCHDIRLKTVVLEPFLDTLSHYNFATFFVLNARVLESMEFQTEAKLHNKELFAKHHRKLQLAKASRGARFYFTTTSCQHGVWRAKHPRDFDFNDPFLHVF